MRKIPVAIICLLLSCYCFSQTHLSKFRQQSWQTIVFKITSAETEQFIKWDSIALTQFIQREPAVVLQPGSWNEDSLATGNYVFISASGIYAEAKLVCISKLLLLSINNRNKLQLDIRNKEGAFIENAKVFVNDKEAVYNEAAKTFWISSRKLEDAFVKVYAAGDTLYTTLDKKDEYRIRPLSQQRRQNWRSTKLHHTLNWFPLQLKKWLGKRRYYANNRIGAKGYIIFNQPKYKPLDTVKFKGHVVDKHGRQYNKNIDIYLNYNHNGENYDQLINTLQPVSSGAYFSQFVLADTIPMDINCRLVFKTAKQKEIISNHFKTEDYLLDEMATYSFKTTKAIYFRNDSLRFTAAAKDANGLNVLDAKATLLLLTNKVNGFYKDTLLVADTIYKKKIVMATDKETIFSIAASELPQADISIRAKLIFKNSNNELHEEEKEIEYKYQSREIVVIQQDDSLKAVYVEDGKEKEATGEYYFNYETERAIEFPAKVKIDFVAEDYSFEIYDSSSKKIISTDFTVENNYRLNFARISSGDTMGFVLSNPYKIPVYYTILNGNNIIASGKGSNAEISWKKVTVNPKQSYKLRWQYIWAGKEEYGEETLGLLYKLLNIKINTSATVYPGQKDSVQIDITDYKGQPAENVNLTAVSYNNQFSNNIRVPEPPYLAKYKNKKYLQYPGFEATEDEFELTKKYLLGKNTAWINKLHLDTMPYYRLLFPKESMQDEAWPINTIVPQLSVNVVQQGVPQEIYLLYINRKLVYYNGVTDKMNYAFEVFPENVQIGIRLKDRFIEIDSLYLQPGYKHELSFDLDKLPQHSKVKPAEKHWSFDELLLLERSIWQMQNDYQNNFAYLWQGNSVVHLNGNREHTSGPFATGSITFFSPGNFDIQFYFESGYQYRLTKGVARLEKKLLFPMKDKKNYLPAYYNSRLLLDDTVTAPPVIFYPPLEKTFSLKVNNEYEFAPYALQKSGTGGLYFTKPKDSSFRYLIMEPADTVNRRIIINLEYRPYNVLKNIAPGTYTLLLVTNKNDIAQSQPIEIKSGFTSCIKMDKTLFSKTNELFNAITEADVKKIPVINEEPKEDNSWVNNPDRSMFIAEGGAIVTGKIIDKKGKLPIAGATIKLKGYRTGTSTDMGGNFIFNGLKPGKYVLQFLTVGYEKQEAEVTAEINGNIKLEISLKVSEQHLQEVVVVGYGTAKRKDITGSIVTISGSNLELTNSLAGKVSGLKAQYYNSPAFGADTIILLRGAKSINDTNNPLYVIDGILFDTLPQNIDPANIEDMSILKDANAIALYGARASNGVIVITTKAKNFRQQFKDYALWQPNFFTDKNGHAAIPVQYPDNITAWKTFVVGMDKKNRMGKSYTLTQAYKPIMAELSVPQFLIEGDSVEVIGKNKNYTTDKYSISTSFTINGKTLPAKQKELQPKSAVTEMTSVTGIGDTIKTAYTLQSTTGFKDGEERKIPVLKKGTEESVGNFWILKNDSAITFSANQNMKEVIIYAQNNTLDMMLEELEHLRKYPYYCMEQTASKLTGLALEKKIREQLGQSFKNKKEFDKLLQKIQKAQLFDGGWSWWENGKANFYITNYITTALLKFRETPLVETNIRNAFLYLHNQLPFLKQHELLAALSTLSSGQHEMNYTEWLNKISFDSLDQHQQWQYVHIQQQQKMNYTIQLKKLVDKKTETMLGGVHWGSDNYSWYSNDIASTVLAYKVLANEPGYKDVCNAVIQYFLEKRRNGYWVNTVESATILDAILPQVLLQQKDFTAAAAVSISGDTSITITNFPYKTNCSSNIKNISISKTGGGMVYFTAYQNFFNTQPQPVADKFVINTSFKQNNKSVAFLKAGEKTTMIVTVNVLKDAEYVQVEIPIPAGCTYASKINNNWQLYKEFFKNKVLLFAESLPKGIHHFEIELEPRYSGSFTINPAKASLMYFPIFYGRNEIKRLLIEK